jgi:hypothetical protein
MQYVGDTSWTNLISTASLGADISAKADKVDTAADSGAAGQVAIISSNGNYEKGGTLGTAAAMAVGDFVRTASTANDTMAGTYNVTGTMSVPTPTLP